mmetsp:Transcript_14838/g.28478  ORF Transcript_14838/g.28478 Transcript_14838/m.28478 type:complete len:209 (-) Transcript_14838:376-1002(-)
MRAGPNMDGSSDPVSRLFPNLIHSSAVSSPNPSGRLPVSSLSVRSTLINPLETSTISDGNAPRKELSPTSRYWSDGPKIAGGSVPDISLLPTARSMRSVRAPREGGTVPVRAFRARLSCRRAVIPPPSCNDLPDPASPPSSDGIVPLSPFRLSVNALNDVNCANSGAILPPSPLSLRFSDVSWEFSHSTPYQPHSDEPESHRISSLSH